MLACTCTCLRHNMLKLLQLYLWQQCCLKFTQGKSHRLVPEAYSILNTLKPSLCKEDQNCCHFSTHFTPLVPTVEIKLSNNHIFAWFTVGANWICCLCITFDHFLFYNTKCKLWYSKLFYVVRSFNIASNRNLD